MICEDHVKKYCSEDISLIENYDKAIADQEEIWDCHHRREISEQKSGKQLIDENMYFGRPAFELIFLTKAEHNRIHNKNRRPETLAKMSASMKGNKNPMFGKSLSEETRQKLSAALKGKHLSEETRAKMSAAQKGNKNPMFGKHLSEETRAKMSAALKGKKRKPFSLEHCAKLSAAKKGKHHSAETRAKMSEAKKGKHHSEETRAKISAAMKGKRKSAGGFIWRFSSKLTSKVR